VGTASLAYDGGVTLPGEQMDPITYRFIERLLAVIVGGMAVFLGYRMFLMIPESRDSQGKITLPWNITVVLSRVGPGVFFALFGAGVVALSLYNELKISEHNGASWGREVNWGAAPTSSGDTATRADARALLRRDIAVLNNVTNSLRSDLPEHERTPLELAIPRIKFALMKPVWGVQAVGWGTPS
jgi:hypothetical protein